VIFRTFSHKWRFFLKANVKITFLLKLLYFEQKTAKGMFAHFGQK
jgi:hypothetical protein